MLEIAWWVMGAAFLAYVLTAGADFGGGLWHLFATGSAVEKRAQKNAIEHAIAPIWEANHVWLIFLVVVMFSAYPRGFAVLAIAFHVPLVIALVGIVLRGASFVFRAYGIGRENERDRWGNVFAWASAFTPVALGAVLAGASSGAIVVQDGIVVSGLFAGWSTFFALATGLFALALFALLAAAYLAVDGPDETREHFRKRAIASEVVAGALALVVYLVAGRDAPVLREHIGGGSMLFTALQAATAACALGATGLLVQRRFAIARMLVVAQVSLVVMGWGAAMRGQIVLGAVPLADAGTNPETLRAILPVIGAGSLVLLPSLVYLFRLFRRTA